MTTQALLIVGAGTVVLFALFGLLELAVRRWGAPHETTRRFAHVIAAGYAILVYLQFDLGWFIGVALLFVVVMLVSMRRRIFTSIHQTRRKTLGELYLPVGVIAAALVAEGYIGSGEPRVYVVAVAVMGLADVAAGFTGDLLKSDKKTWWGTLACAVVAGGIVLAGGYPFWIAAAVAVAVAVVERVSSRGVDNLTVPVVAALLLAVLQA